MSDETPIPAATVVLLRDAPAFEVLMIERHEKIGFAGGALVFPGGRVDPGDRDAAWASHATGLSADPAHRAAQVASIREAFEETGILIAREEGADEFVSGARAAAVDPWRKQIEKDDAQFLELARRERLTLAADALHLFAHWIAPPGLHRRFDTLFFAAACPPGQEAREDGDEATEALWIAPEAVIAARAAGTRKLIFPTARNVELLALSRSVEETLAFAATRKIAAVTPAVEMREGAPWLVIPDDLGHPITEEPLDPTLRG